MISFIKQIFFLIDRKNTKIYKNLDEYKLDNQSSYSNDLLNSYRCEKFLKNFNEIKLGKQDQQREIFRFLSLNKIKQIPKLKILDIGGGFGDNYFFLLNKFNFEYSILENENLIKYVNKIPKNNILYYTNLEQCLMEFKPNILFSSASINYLDDPYGSFECLSKYNFNYIYLTRNAFSKKEGVVRQISYLSANGHGDHLSKYKDSKIYYFKHLLNEDKIKKFFKKKYKIKTLRYKMNSDYFKTYSKNLLIYST